MDRVVNLYVTGLVVQMRKNVCWFNFFQFCFKKKKLLLKIHPNNTIVVCLNWHVEFFVQTEQIKISAFSSIFLTNLN